MPYTTRYDDGHAHEQVSASTIWTITHGLGLDAPAVNAWIDVTGTLTAIAPASVVATDSNTVTLTFSSARAGKARVA